MSEHHTPDHTPHHTRNPGPTPPPTFTRAVLDRLQLDPCAAALEQLLEEPGIEAAPQNSQMPRPLIAQHLQHCESCRTLQAALLLSQNGLPALRTRPAPAELRQRILLQTTGRAAPQHQRQRQLSRLQSWLLRPRFALESAYLGSLLFVLVFGLPVSNAIDLQRMEQFTTRLADPLRLNSAHLEQHLEQQLEQQMDQQLERLQRLMQQSDIARRENLSLLERAYQNSREQWSLLTLDTRLWLQQRSDTLLDSIKPDAETPLPLPSSDQPGAPR
ncbi:MAG: hypothetical protein Q7U82_01200 [Gammaproteobacteria bacterium]|nr:hypothetical protein [Gammaproteobacteria bacterium]